MSAAKKIRALRSRGQVLADRLSANGGGRRLEYEELAALAWALPILDDLVARNAERAEDVERRHRDAAFVRLAQVATEALALRDPTEAARLLAECGDDSVRKTVLTSIRTHAVSGLAEHLSQLAAVR